MTVHFEKLNLSHKSVENVTKVKMFCQKKHPLVPRTHEKCLGQIGYFLHAGILVWKKACMYVLTYVQWYFVTKIVLTYCEKKMFYCSRKTFEIRG